MTSKPKKGKSKGNSSKNKIRNEENDKYPKFNPYVFFNGDEITEIKSVLRIKEVGNIPIAIGCVILNKFELLQKVLKQGIDVNEIGPNNSSALVWAVRYKYVDFIEFLLENQADPSMKTDSGDNVVIIALEHKLWDEAIFINFWKKAKEYSSKIDVNWTNKNGHTILHIAVRREWENFIDILLKEDVEIDTPNINGVTPLMTACYRNNLNIVNTLLTKNADLTKEDAHNRTALCYAILSGVKVAKPLYPIAERLIFEMRNDNSNCFKEFIKKTIQMISSLTTYKEKNTETSVDMLINITQYLIQYTEDGVKVLLEFKIMECIQKALAKVNSEEKLKILLLITLELMCYNEQAMYFSAETQQKLSQQFLSHNLTTMCLDSVKRKDSHYMLAFYVVLIFCTSNEFGQKWLRDNYEEFRETFKNLPQDYMNNIQAELTEEKRLKLIKKKLKKLKRTLNTLENPADTEDQLRTTLLETDFNKNEEKKPENLFSLKKSKRRSKLIKAKIAKIKNTEMSERVNLTNIKSNEALNKNLLGDDNTCENSTYPLVNEVINQPPTSPENLKEIVIKTEDKHADIFNDNKSLNIFDWKIGLKHVFIEKENEMVSIGNLDIENGYSETLGNFQQEDIIFPTQDPQTLRQIHENEEIVNTFMTDDLLCAYYEDHTVVNPITDALKEFSKSREDTYEKNKEDVPHYPITNYPEWKSKIYQLPFNDWSTFGEKMKTDKRKLKESIQYLKKLSNTQDHNLLMQDETVASNVDTALQNLMCYLKELLDNIVSRTKAHWDIIHSQNKLKNRNGKNSNISQEKHALQDLQATFTDLTSDICMTAHGGLPEAIQHIYQLESTLLNYPVNGKTLMADVCALENVKIEFTTYSCEAEASFLSYIENVLNGVEDSRDDIKIKIIDEKCNFWEYSPPDLYEKEMALLSPPKPKNKRNELEDRRKTMENAYYLVGSVQHLLDEENDTFPDYCLTLLSSDSPKSNEISLESNYKCSELVLKILTKHVEEKNYSGNQRSRWLEKIQHLQGLKHTHHILLGGDVRLCKFPERSHIISQGGNFNLVTLGLSINDQPLAVKKIPREHCVCKILKGLINPLVGLRNKNLLHYFVCDYEDNDLILATPLCEYNIGQYVLLLKENADKKLFNLNQMDIVKQLLNGVAFLHQRIEPIVHGNLKPSNIFVDINGTVRLAEFGINKALYKLVEAPKSSLIWFSQETYRKYKISSVMECSLSSDIQVAGMLIYFIISGGIHPYGSEILSILKNLERNYTPHFKDSKNQIFADLVTWMLMYEPNDRPNIKQILAHVFFWSNDRRWRFVLNCAGISTNGVPLGINTTELHNAINKMSLQENIKGNWVNLIKKKFPRIKFQGDDSVVGLLKFIRQFYEEQILTEENVSDLKNCILTYFHAFPLTLYRILEATGYIKEFPFISYTVVENLIL